MLREHIGHGKSIKRAQAEMKVIPSEIKKNLQVTNSDGKEARVQIKIWNIRKK